MTSTFTKVAPGIRRYWIKDGREERFQVLYATGRKTQKGNPEVRSKGGFTTLTSARHWQAHNTNALDDGSYLNPQRRKDLFGPYAEAWLENRRDELRPKTYELYSYLLRLHILPALKNTRFRDLTRPELKSWHRELKKTKQKNGTTLSQSTTAKAYRLLRQILDEAVDDGYFNDNPLRIKGAATEPVPKLRIPTPDQVRKLADSVPERYRLMVLLAGFCGLRWGEAIALHATHINLKAGTVTVAMQVVEVTGEPLYLTDELKTPAAYRTVALPPEVHKAARNHMRHAEWHDENGLLFPTTRPRNGRRNFLRKGNFHRTVWTKARTKSGTNVTFHNLRHCANTQRAVAARVAGATDKQLMADMGHASRAASLRYTHATEDQSERLAEALAALLSLPSGDSDESTSNVVPIQG